MKQRLILTLLLALSAMLAAAQVRTIELQLWPDGAPNSNGLSGEETVPYEKHISNVSVPTLTVYLPEQPNGLSVVMCPGGGYELLSMVYEGHAGAEWFCSQGMAYAVLKYRMPNGHREVALSDAARAVRLMRLYAEEWGISPRRVGIMGASAGGHLAAITATTADSLSHPDFQVLLYPVVTMVEGTHIGSRNALLGKNADRTTLEAHSAERRVTRDTPPAFIALSADDRAVHPDNSLNYCAALVRHGIPVGLHVYPDGGHGWGFRDTFKYKDIWKAELAAWLKALRFED